ncbi:hypothetical protein CANINC_001272 [Pichia inconspicua]|uniref:Altered inheritance of mitochondria protein 23, mitochondrial n=1 Tax=Pichia inconspicua TaxID=52247 RepID=A0A4V4NG06_9ASCO|nr:hypothetical protein CANINC_001272 [[Candida] inconspicua]
MNDLKNMLSQAANAKSEPILEQPLKTQEKMKYTNKGKEKTFDDYQKNDRRYKNEKTSFSKDRYNTNDKSFKYDKFSKNDKYGHGQRGKNDKYSKNNHSRDRERLTFLETGNDRDKDAAKRIISEALKSNRKGLVQLIKPNSPVEILPVIKAFKGLILKEKGLLIVGHKNIKEEDENKYGLEVGDKMLILKVTDREQVIKQYGDYLSELVVEKLKLSNSGILEKQKRGKKDDNKGELKIVQIGWNISLSDLKGQKKFEIENHLKKGDDIEIVIDEKDILDKENASQYVSSGNESSADKLEIYANRRKQLSDVEITMRNKMLNIINETLRSIENLSEANIGATKGYIESRILIKVKGIKRKEGEEKLKKKELKALEKKQRAEKIAQRRAEKEKLLAEQVQEIRV